MARASGSAEPGGAPAIAGEALLAALVDPAVLLDQSGRCLLLNAAAAVELGIEPARAVGRRWSELLQASGRLFAIEASVQEAFVTGRALEHGSALVSPVLGADGAPVACLVMLRAQAAAAASATAAELDAERSARFAAEATQQRIQFLYQVTSRLLESSPEGERRFAELARLTVPDFADWCVIHVRGADGGLTRVATGHWDPAKLESASGWPVALSAADAPALSAAIASGAVCRVDGSGDDAVLAACDARSALIVPFRVRGAVQGTATFVFAESNRRYGDDDLAVAIDVGHRFSLAVENARLLEDTQRAVREREDMLSVVSHDLKNPVQVVLLSTTLLEAGLGEDNPLRRRVDAVRRSAEQMDRLIKMLLEAARIDAGLLTINPQPHAIGAVVREAADLIRPLAQSKSIHFELASEARCADVVVPLDRDRIDQALGNLLGNAVKFTPDGQRITLTLACDESAVRVEVIDTGPGIPEALQPHLFKRFTQGPGAERKGSGLGLYIARAIVEGHGGRIGVRSKPGEGSAFWFEIPRAPR